MKTVKTILLIAIPLMLLACSQDKEKKNFTLNGAWLLESIVMPDDFKYNYPHDNVGILRIYDDSCFYECHITTAPNGTLVTPSNMSHYTIFDKGNNGYIYLQENNRHPLIVQNDSTVVIQQTGRRYTWNKTSIYDEERINAIISIVKNDDSSEAEYSCRYVFSDVEKKLKTYNHTLVYILIYEKEFLQKWPGTHCHSVHLMAGPRHCYGAAENQRQGNHRCVDYEIHEI